MERDFELEYRELKQNETPDLWNRIEAGLSEKKIATVPLENESKSIDIERFVVKKQTPWKRWGLLAAACLCVVIIFPAVLIGLTDSYQSNNSGSTDSASSTAFDASPAEAAAEEGKSETEYTENTAADVGTADVGSMAGESEAIVRILSVDIVDGQDIYTAVVEESYADNILIEGMQICIICDSGSEYTFPRGTRDETALKTGESYSVTLRYEAEYGQDGEDGSVANGGDFVFYAVTLSTVEK